MIFYTQRIGISPMRYRMMTIYRGIPLLISLSLDFANRQKYLLEFFIVMLIGGFRCLEK